MLERLTIDEFGRSLLQTRDLDPVYVLLHRAALEPTVLRRWLLAYWCFYHVGTASWIADSASAAGYWRRMEVAAGSKDYPRCHERRHFRGAFAGRSVDYLHRRGLHNLFNPLTSSRTLGLAAIMFQVQTWYGFGSWIAFKVADMLERLGLCQVEFDAGAMFLFDSPRQGAEMLWRLEGEPDAGSGKLLGTWAVNKVLSRLGGTPAPPTYDRPINVQEVETILCKWKAHMNGHYEVGEDIAAAKTGLMYGTFSRSKLNQRLYKAGMESGLWGNSGGG